MNFIKLVVVPVVISGVALMVACSSSSTGGGSTGDGGTSSSTSSSSSSGSTAASCGLTGKYKVHYTKDASSTGMCSDLPDQTIDFDKQDGGGAPSDAGSGCNIQQTGDCAFTIDCTFDQSGIMSITHSQFDANNGSPNGSFETKVTGTPNGVADHDCKYTETYTKQ